MLPGFGGEHTENGWVDVVLRNATNVDEFFHGIFVRDVTGLQFFLSQKSPK